MISENEYKLAQVADLLKALGHSVRMQVLVLLTEYKEMNVSSIQIELQIAQPALSHHLIKMKSKRILKSRRVGRELHYSIENPELATLLSCLCSSFGICYSDFLEIVPSGNIKYSLMSTRSNPPISFQNQVTSESERICIALATRF